jgi:hypothetical protein
VAPQATHTARIHTGGETAREALFDHPNRDAATAEMQCGRTAVQSTANDDDIGSFYAHYTVYRTGPPVAKALTRRFLYGKFKPPHARILSAINDRQITEMDAVIMRKHIPLEGLSNFRDLGEYEINSGKAIK